MSWPFVTRRRYEQELAAVKADRERIRGERNQFAEDRDAHRNAASTAARLYAEADATNRRLADRVKVLTDRLNAAVGPDSVLDAALLYRAAYWSAHGKALWLTAELAEAKLHLTDTRIELEDARTANRVLHDELQAATPPPSAKALREKAHADQHADQEIKQLRAALTNPGSADAEVAW